MSKTMNKELIRLNLNRIKEAKELTYAEIARYMGVKRQNVQNWGVGYNAPSPENLIALAEALGVTPKTLHTPVNQIIKLGRNYEFFAKMAHNLNRAWSYHTKMLPRGHVQAWLQLPIAEKRKRVATFRKLSKEYEICELSRDDVAQALHNGWMETAPATHPSNKPWDKLVEADRSKDYIYLFVLELCAHSPEEIEA